jgi:hypothetical protein
MRLIEIYPGLIASDFLLTEEGHAWQVWLWKTPEDLGHWDRLYGANDGEPALGRHTPLICEADAPCQLLGHLHFCKGEWSEGVVAHEMLHGLFHYVKVCVPGFVRAIYLFMEEEEEICYPFGDWIEWLKRFLWKHDPNEKWKKIE